jgi:hypothetical protein
MTTTNKLQGIDYILDPAKRTKTGKPTRRKPTTDELAAKAQLLADVQRKSDEIRAQRSPGSIACTIAFKLDRLEREFAPKRIKDRPADVLAYIDRVQPEIDRVIKAVQAPSVAPNFYRLSMAAAVEARGAKVAKPRKRKAPAKAEPAPSRTVIKPTGMESGTIPFSAEVAFAMSGKALREALANPAFADVAQAEIDRRKAKRAVSA